MDIQADIVAVTVYPDRVRVVRQVALNLDAGISEVRLTNLTTLLDPRSVRVSGQGTARARLLGVQVREAYYVEPPSVPVVELEKRLQERQAADQTLADEEALLKSQIEFLQSLAGHAGASLAQGLGLGRAKVGDADALLEFFKGSYAPAMARRREVAVDRRMVAREIERLQQELNRIQSARPRQRYEAMVEVQVLERGELTLTLEYTTQGGAGWQPLYDLRLLSEPGASSQVELVCQGQVQQSTGEDWPHVALTLSTARPAASAQLPKLAPWYINLLRPLPPPAVQSFAPRMAAPAVEFARRDVDELTVGSPPEPEPIVAEVVQATVDTGGAAVTFHIPHRMDIPADGASHKAAIQTLDFTPQIDFVAAPKLSGDVFRRATIKNDTELTLLPGPLMLFYGNEFVGQARLDKVSPGETFKTTLGLEDRIKVERRLVLNEVGKQLIGERRVRRYAYEIEAQNLLPDAATLVVQDQLPVAGSEDIRIKEENMAPPPTRKTDLNELTWEMRLEPQQKQVIRFEFTISSPRNSNLTGLPEE